MTKDEINALAKQAGGTTEEFNHHSRDEVTTFGPVALAEFVRLVREPSRGETTDMTLRAYFAAKAMQGYIATEAGIHVTESMLAECAYRVADAMLEAMEST